MTAPRRGDKVRVTFDATYEEDFGGGWHQVDAGHSQWLPLVPPHATIELIEDLRLGDVYRATPDDEGQVPHIVTYVGDNIDAKPWYCLTCSQPARDFLVPRPLILLIRDGRVVA